MSELLNGLKRTCYCAELTEKNIGEKVILMGWMAKRRNLGSLIFVDLRDRSGLVQVVFDQSTLPCEDFERAESLRNEFVLCVIGKVVMRDEAMFTDRMATGKIEVIVDSFKILAKSETPPIVIDDDVNVQEQLRLKYRYLDLRRPVMQSNLRLRHRVSKIARDYYDAQGFIEIETPMLTKSTPEGARDYLVPSRVFPGEFFALPQSPQLFKQLLMLSGFDRYFQITKCFRDEDLRADRQPEFSQIDVEMSFVEEEDVMTMSEGLVKAVFKGAMDIDVEAPFRRLTYAQAMDRFGSDKPDTRFGLELIDLSKAVNGCDFKVFTGALEGGGSVRAINAKGLAASLSRRDIDGLVEFTKLYKAKGMAWLSIVEGGIKSSFAKFVTEEIINKIISLCSGEVGDILFFVADTNNDVVYNSLGALRLELAKRFELIDQAKVDLLWVTDFPLLEYDDEAKRYVAKHHPFTSPKDEDMELLESDPGKVRAKAYDIILNGNELGGGSIRIHSAELQQRMFTALGFTKEEAENRFGFLMNAFKYGTPPHGGLAFGLDRFIMLLTGSPSIRDVIAFPKVQNSSCLMTDAPSAVDEKQLKELHLK